MKKQQADLAAKGKGRKKAREESASNMMMQPDNQPLGFLTSSFLTLVLAHIESLLLHILASHLLFVVECHLEGR